MDVTHYTHSVECEGLSVQYDLCYPGKGDKNKYKCDVLPIDENSSYTQKVSAFEKAYNETLVEIDRLTNHADGIDYTVAVASGIVAGIIDLVWVGEFSIDRANEWGNEKVKNFVVWVAQKQGYSGDDLHDAVASLEKEFSIAADKVTNDFGGGKQHHLRDFSHHPTPVGLFFSLLTQFTGNVYGTDVAGIFKVAPLSADDFNLIGKTLPEKITFGVINWSFHMVSDMVGSSTSIREGSLGTGLPGPIVSLLKELSALPIFRSINKKGYKEFSVWVSKLFNGTLLAKRDSQGKIIEAVKFDLRTEIGVAYELGRQAIPVIVNECVVRAFYFLRRLFNELKENDVRSIPELQNINWKKTLPAKNRTITRMLTIATGTMEVIDLADAAIRSGGVLPMFLLRVNFVGVGRFAVAGSVDMMMEMKKSRLELAMASAEVAKTAQVTHSVIGDVEQRRMQTQDKMDRLTSKINGEPPMRNQDIRRGFSMDYTINNIEIDTNEFTPADAKEVAEQIFSLKSEEFQNIKDAPWYRRFLKAVTFRSDGKKMIISDVTSLGKLQQLFLRVYLQHYEGLSNQLDRLINAVDQVNDKVERMRSGLELQDDIQMMDRDNAAILQLLLSEYKSKSGKEEEFQQYRRAIIKVFGDANPKGTFNSSMLANNMKFHALFCRCLYEMAAIDGCLESGDFPPTIEIALYHLAVSEVEKRDIKQAVLRQASALGIEYFIKKYQSAQFTDFDWTGFAVEEYHEITDDYSENDLLVADTNDEEDNTAMTAEEYGPYPEIEACIKKHINKPGKPFGTPQKNTGKLLQKLLPENGPAINTVVSITKIKTDFMIFTTFAVYYISGKCNTKIPYKAMNPENIMLVSRGKDKSIRFEESGEVFEIKNCNVLNGMECFAKDIYSIREIPNSDLLTPFDNLSEGVRIGYFHIIARIMTQGHHPLHELFRLVCDNTFSEYWPVISAESQEDVANDIQTWEDMIPYPNKEALCQNLLADLCRVQFRTSAEIAIGHKEREYLLQLLSNSEEIESIRDSVIREEQQEQANLSSPLPWKRYAAITNLTSFYRTAIEIARRNGYSDIQNTLEATLDAAKEKAGTDPEVSDAQEEPINSTDYEAMRKKSEKIVYGFLASTTATGAVPIPFADMPLLIGQQVAMLATINQTFHIEMGKDALKSLVSAVLGVGGASLIGKATVSSLLKLIPGGGSIAGGAISAGTAGIVTLALGKAYIEICMAIKKGTLTQEELVQKIGIDTLKNAFKTQLASVKKEKDKI